MTIGDRIKQRRLELGLSADDLGKRINKNRATIYRYESNDIENLPTTVIPLLAKALETTPAYIMGWMSDEEIEHESEEIKYNSDDIVRDESERKLLMLCRNATKANPEDKEALIETFESTIDMYLKAKGLK